MILDLIAKHLKSTTQSSNELAKLIHRPFFHSLPLGVELILKPRLLVS